METTFSTDPIESAIAAQTVLQQSKDWKMGELSKVKRAQNKELSIIDNACTEMCKNITDPIQKAQLKLEFQAKKLEVKAKYKDKFDGFKVKLEDVSEVLAAQAAEKLGSIVAPATKGAVGFFSAFAKRAGLKK